MKRLLFSMMLLVASIASFAYDFEVDGIYYNVLSTIDLTCEVTYKGSSSSASAAYTGNVNIPSQVSYEGKVLNVKGIGHYAFSSCSSLTSVNIPNSVTSIGHYAFYSCSSLTSITIPSSVTSIEYDAFARCSSLTSIIIPSGVKSIGREAFSGCSSLTSVTIPNSVRSIGTLAFWKCSSLTSVNIPNSVTYIGDNAFASCSSLTSVTIPNSVTSIGERAFGNCSSLRSVIIGNSVTGIGINGFKDCSELKDIICLAVTPPSCSTNTFDGIKKMECTVKVPEESIDAYKVAEVWKSFWNIVAIDGEGGGNNPGGDPEKCVTPTIALQDGKIVVTTSTEGAECNTNITTNDVLSTQANEIELTGVYTITAYASKAGLWNSETATATLVWANPTIEGTGIMSMEMKKVLLLRSNGNSIIVEGLEEGEKLELYSINGMMLDKVTSSGTSTTLGNGLQKHQTYIIKVGNRSIKYML